MDQAAAPIEALLAVSRQAGTPTYAYDISWLRRQVGQLRGVLPSSIRLLYCLKANPALAVCEFMAQCGLGADVASEGELVTALAAGVAEHRIFLGGPYKSRECLARLRSLPNVVLSVDSVSELQALVESGLRNQLLLRLRPDFASLATVATGPHSRFGIPFDKLPECRPFLQGISVSGFHVFSGSQILDPLGVIHHLEGAMDLSCRAAEYLGIDLQILNLGGGFGTPYGPEDQELALLPIGEALDKIVARLPSAEIVLELGRYFVAEAGWYLAAVVATQSHRGRQAVVVDGGTHHRADICGLGLRTKALPPIVLKNGNAHSIPTDVLGCLCLPDDLLAELAPLPPLKVGDVLAFPNAGAYGLSASPVLFLGHPLPAEVVFDSCEVHVLRHRQPADALLAGQRSLRGKLYP